jgi:hypothetical protein
MQKIFHASEFISYIFPQKEIEKLQPALCIMNVKMMLKEKRVERSVTNRCMR